MRREVTATNADIYTAMNAIADGRNIIDDMDAQMKNWARWAHDKSMPKLDVPEPPMSEFWNPYGDHREPGWGDSVPGDRIEDAIDWKAAEAIDGALLRLPVSRWYLLRRHYYHKATQPEIELQACLRALARLMEM